MTTPCTKLIVVCYCYCQLLAHSIYNDILPQPHKRNKIDNTAVERRSNDNKNFPPNRKIARRSKAIATYGRMMILKGVLFCWIADEVYSLAIPCHHQTALWFFGPLPLRTPAVGPAVENDIPDKERLRGFTPPFIIARRRYGTVHCCTAPLRRRSIFYGAVFCRALPLFAVLCRTFQLTSPRTLYVTKMSG